MGDERGRWEEDAILPELAAPPADSIQVRGAQLVHRLNVEAHNTPSREGYTEAVILAWAPLPDGGWAVLAAWLGAWRREDGRTTGKARYGWCRLLEDRVRPVDPPRTLIDGAEWHGHHELSQFALAVRQAALLLPENLREAALTPKR